MAKFFLIDGTALLYRAYFAFIANPLRSSKGENTSAIFGVANSFLKLLDKEKVENVIISFDLKAPTFRHKITETYKANRPQAPDELISQIEPVKEYFRKLKIPEVSIPGFEADDVLATLAENLKQKHEVVIVTSDKDFCQLVDERVTLFDPFSEKTIDEKRVKEKYGVTAEQFSDYLALVGDQSDNIPGVKGIGPKGASQLLNRFPRLDDIFDNIDQIESKSLRDKLIKGKEEAYLSRKLALIVRDVPISDVGLNTEDLAKQACFDNKNFSDILTFLERYDLKSVYKKIKQMYPDIEEESKEPAQGTNRGEDDQLAFNFFAESTNHGFDIEKISSEEELPAIEKSIENSEGIAIYLVYEGENPLHSEIIGTAFCLDEVKVYYMRFQEGHDSGLSHGKYVSFMNKLCSAKTVIAHNLKPISQVLDNYRIRIAGPCFDTMIASYLLDAFSTRHGLDLCAQKELQYDLSSIQEILGKGSKRVEFSELDKDKVADFAAENAHITYRLFKKYKQRLTSMRLDKLFYDVEMPLVKVLAKMEQDGVYIDLNILEDIDQTLASKVEELGDKIHEISGSEFNINSPQQLAKVLFEDLELPPVKKTKTGYSTDNQVLEALAEEHKIAKLLVEYRQLSKLRSTYTNSLPKLIDNKSGRIHSSFNQTVTTTGRLSSSNPNLQNIPIRSRAGKQIRKAFAVDNEKKVIIAADYSQIELRILGIMSRDRNLITAFTNEQDIHAQTAGMILNKPITMINQDERRMAKTINFGILYGMGPQKLSRELDISLSQAKEFIDTYFTKFPQIRDFIKAQVKRAKSQGYAETLTGRRLSLPDINSSNKKYSSEAERIAVNMPIQGSAADVIKIAMINVAKELDKLPAVSGEPPAKLIIQVHDELVLECFESTAAEVKKMVVKEMKYALPERYRTIIQLAVDIGSGKNWFEAHE